jgi:carboxymethylenebutenolidase
MRPLHPLLPLALAVVAVAACAAEDAPAHRPGPDPSETPAPQQPAPHPITGGLSEAEFAALHERTAEVPPAPRGHAVELPGVDARAYLSLPDGTRPPLPGVLVVHEWWGLDDHIRHYADRVAAEGYAALAVDLYGGETAETRERAMELVRAVEEPRAREVMAAAHRFLVEDARVRAPRTGVLGWCFGGRWALLTALAEPELDAAVVYYGQPVVEREALRPLSVPLLGVYATRDTSIPVARVREMQAELEALGKPHRVLFFDAEHAFANPSGGRYDAGAAAEAWEAARAFLAEHLR